MGLPRLSSKLEDLRVEVRALGLALGDDRVPAHAKAVIFLVVGYALSPADLLPDFIPFLGQLDDFVIVPIGLTLAWKLVPGDVRREIRDQAQEEVADAPPVSGALAAALAAVWMAVGYAVSALLADR